MPATAFKYFREDKSRAKEIVLHAAQLPTTTPAQTTLRSDLHRSGWMFSVGALDAYFSDAYADLIAATIIAKSRQGSMTLPDFFGDIQVPVSAILEPYQQNENWRWRMASRKMMEKKNFTQLDAIQSMFNKFFRKQHKLFKDQLGDWIDDQEAKRRLFGVTRETYINMNPTQQKIAINDGWDQMQTRFASIFQRRHDCIHNCDRPKTSPQPLASSGTVIKVIQDIDFLVTRCDRHIDSEFKAFLSGTGCTLTTISQLGY